MKRLLLATIALFAIAGVTFMLMSNQPQLDAGTLKKIKLVSRFKETLPKADAGDAKAQFEIAKMYETGDGTRKDLRQAVKWYMRAADQGNADAQFAMGKLYADGTGVRQDFAVAAKWYRIAATFNNHPEAQFRLGELYFNGRGVEHDYGKAIQYYTLAAKQGHAAAQYLLGSMFEAGWGVPRDLITAYMWLKLAVPNREQALAVHKKYDPVKKLAKLKTEMNNFQIEEAEKRLAELARLKR